MNRSKPLARAIVTMLASSALLCLAACAPKVGQQITKAQESYDAGRYDEAYKEAVAAYDSSASDVKSGDDGASSAKNEDAARAAYLAGLSAYQLENYNDSERYLEAALGAGEGELAGRAQAQLGAVALKEKRYVDAAEAYEGAAKLLSGDEADKARQRAEQARRQINATPAIGSPAGGMTAGGSAGGSGGGAGGGAGGGGARSGGASAAATAPKPVWTLQGGCYREKANAEKQAKALNTMTMAKGVGPARVVAQQDSALGTVYCIFIGEYSTRSAADAARTAVGRPEFFVRTVGRAP